MSVIDSASNFHKPWKVCTEKKEWRYEFVEQAQFLESRAGIGEPA